LLNRADGAAPSGGLWSTVADLLSFAEFMLADAGLLAAVRAPRTGTSAPVQYGLGWALAAGLMFHIGRLDGFRSVLLTAPEHHYCVAMVVNGTDALPAIASFVDGLQASLTGVPVSARLMF
jgi:CubicO group peptidase (beta-lactamase class C family)